MYSPAQTVKHLSQFYDLSPSQALQWATAARQLLAGRQPQEVETVAAALGDEQRGVRQWLEALLRDATAPEAGGTEHVAGRIQVRRA